MLNQEKELELLEYQLEVLAWRHSLTEHVVRSLASDYLQGRIEPATADAFKEYEHRWGPHTKGFKRLNKSPQTIAQKHRR